MADLSKELSKELSKDFAYCEDTISRKAAIDALKGLPTWWADAGGYYGGAQPPMVALLDPEDSVSAIENLPSVQPEKRTEERMETHACDLIDREAAVDAIYHHLPSVSRTRARTMLHEVPSAQPDSKELSFTHKSLDTVSRQEAIEVIDAVFPVDPMKSEYAQGIACGAALAKTYVEQLPSVQPERTCVTCGRTVNNGGWYADGRTRCPIEEHYALPKDGYCHLWEKRNVTDDDYPERREE